MNVVATKEQIEHRQEICAACPFRKEVVAQRVSLCSKCGCPIYSKIRFALSQCPEGRW